MIGKRVVEVDVSIYRCSLIYTYWMHEAPLSITHLITGER